MDDPTDLSARRPGDGREDDDVVRGLRAALGEPAEVPAGQRAPREVLVGLERRAARHHRRRQAVSLAGAAAAAAVVVAVGGLVLPQLPSFTGYSSGSSAGGGAAGSSAAQGSDRALSAPAAAGSPEATTTSEPSPPVVSESSLLQVQDVQGFLGADPAGGTVSDGSASGLALGACVDGSAGSVDVTTVWRSDWQAAAVPQGALAPPGVVERVAAAVDPATAAAAVTALRGDAAGCTGPGLEGRGPTSELDASGLVPPGGSAVALAAPGGTGGTELQVLVATSGGLLVDLQALSPLDDGAAALSSFAPVVDAAVQRAVAASGAS